MSAPTQPLSPEQRQLEARLGPRAYARRISRQRFKHAGNALKHGNLRVALRERAFDLLPRLLKAAGLWQRARRNFRDLRIEEHTWHLPRLPSAFHGFRLLQITDLHLDADPGLTPRIVELLRPLHYHATVVTGDFRNHLTGPFSQALALTEPVIAALRGPRFGILGNHDFLGQVPMLEAIGLPMLLNECAHLERDGKRLYFAGIDDTAYYQTHDLKRATEHIPQGACWILLAHAPNAFREALPYKPDLMLCGHTHGGQVCLPGRIALIRRFACPSRMISGPWQYHGIRGYTSRGTGGCRVPVRLFCPPEITLHRLLCA